MMLRELLKVIKTDKTVIVQCRKTDLIGSYYEYMFGHDYFMLKKLKIVKDRKIYRFKVNRWGKTCDIEIK